MTTKFNVGDRVVRLHCPNVRATVHKTAEYMGAYMRVLCADGAIRETRIANWQLDPAAVIGSREWLEHRAMAHLIVRQ